MPNDNMTTKEPKTLVGLPAEMLEQVLSNLTAKELCRAQSVCKFFQDFIEDHCGAIVRPLISREKARVTVLLDKVVNLSHLSFLEMDEVLKRYYEHYGAPAFNTDTFHTFCYNWLDSFPPEKVKSRVNIAFCVLSIVGSLEERLGFQASPLPQRNIFRVTLAVLQQHDNNGFDNEETADGLRQAIDRALLITPSLKGSCFIRQPDVPRFVLTPRYGLSSSDYDGKAPKYPGTFEGVGEWLGLPNLSAQAYIAYCVKTEGVHWVAVDAYSREKDKLSALKQAAVLEELFIW